MEAAGAYSRRISDLNLKRGEGSGMTVRKAPFAQKTQEATTFYTTEKIRIASGVAVMLHLMRGHFKPALFHTTDRILWNSLARMPWVASIVTGSQSRYQTYVACGGAWKLSQKRRPTAWAAKFPLSLTTTLAIPQCHDLYPG